MASLRQILKILRVQINAIFGSTMKTLRIVNRRITRSRKEYLSMNSHIS